MTVPTLKVYQWAGAHTTSSISFKIGNNLDGNVTDSSYGFMGLLPSTLSGRLASGAATTPYGQIWTLPQRGWTFYANAGQSSIYENGAGRGTATGLVKGDKLTVQFTKDGIVSYLVNDVLFYTSVLNMSAAASNDYDYHAVINQAKRGSAGKYHSYDWTFQGEVNANPYWFDKQLDQELVDVPVETWGSESYDEDNAIPFSTIDGHTAARIRGAGGPGYADVIWSEYFVTGSGAGGLMRWKYSDVPGLMPWETIQGCCNHDFNGVFNHQTLTYSARFTPIVWSGDNYSNSEYEYDTWYFGNEGGAGLNTGKFPVTSGSQMALIVTGSDFVFLATTGSGQNIAPSPDNGSVVAALCKAVNSEGLPFSDYVSSHWNMMMYSFKSNAGSTINAQKITISDGKAGRWLQQLQVGNNYIISGSI
jgi:hypothetical protein